MGLGGAEGETFVSKGCQFFYRRRRQKIAVLVRARLFDCLLRLRKGARQNCRRNLCICHIPASWTRKQRISKIEIKSVNVVWYSPKYTYAENESDCVSAVSACGKGTTLSNMCVYVEC